MRCLQRIAFIGIAVFTGPLFPDPFSFAAIQTLETEKCPEPQFFTASDGVKIAYYSYIPSRYDRTVFLIHGGGAHSCAGYQYLARKLQNSGIAVFTMDLRGHGKSGGARGDTPSVEQPFRDLTQLIGLVEGSAGTKKHRIVLLGHSSGAGFLLNYAAQKDHVVPDQYVFLAPEPGYRANTARTTDSPFAKPKIWVFVASAFTGGHLFANRPAVHLQYPEWILKKDPLLLTYLTRNMALTLTPDSPEREIRNVSDKTRILIGSDDEVVDAQKLLRFIRSATASPIPVTILPTTTHLSILERADEIEKAIRN